MRRTNTIGLNNHGGSKSEIRSTGILPYGCNSSSSQLALKKIFVVVAPLVCLPSRLLVYISLTSGSTSVNHHGSQLPHTNGLTCHFTSARTLRFTTLPAYTWCLSVSPYGSWRGVEFSSVSINVDTLGLGRGVVNSTLDRLQIECKGFQDVVRGHFRSLRQGVNYSTPELAPLPDWLDTTSCQTSF